MGKKLNIDKVDILRLFKDVPVTTAQLPDYAIAQIRYGSKIHIDFANLDYYLLTSTNHLSLFGKHYLGALLIIKDTHRIEMYRVFIHATTVVFSCGAGQSYLIPGNNNGDILWEIEREHPSELRKHFANLYSDLLKNDPVQFENYYAGLFEQFWEPKLYDDGSLVF